MEELVDDLNSDWKNYYKLQKERQQQHAKEQPLLTNSISGGSILFSSSKVHKQQHPHHLSAERITPASQKLPGALASKINKKKATVAGSGLQTI